MQVILIYGIAKFYLWTFSTGLWREKSSYSSQISMEGRGIGTLRDKIRQKVTELNKNKSK